MSGKRPYPSSIASTASDGLDQFSRDDHDDIQHDLSTDVNQETIGQTTLEKLTVQEFLPSSAHDPILSILRELFVHSFDHFYKEIEVQLKLKSNKTLIEWLQETFDEMKDEMLTKKCRCFMLCSSDTVKNYKTQGIVGFLTLKEEGKGSVYISQCAIEAENKRRGYGARLLLHLRTIYPPGTSYWGLCRRANIPAVKFYLKQGAKFIDNEEIATKYGYDPALYTGFQFTDTIGYVQSSDSHSSTLPSTSPTTMPTFEPLTKRRSNVTYVYLETVLFINFEDHVFYRM
ncbi:unnamed protein product [Rotaria sp. Silwood1]|nr:unnamed protein product [Rotaria sp. Silwood1]CAF1642463.1 unnamed protein product [Rotaria sp. Silwood1]CAF3779461.1 unnamed protein product [Rotaria sp. Silwood1]CAF3815233.1 unnamed protein product [Rotaria sp. Silwood1]CAF3834189.1 unnamed protein product [Rotaria sp. Silwood1]